MSLISQRINSRPIARIVRMESLIRTKKCCIEITQNIITKCGTRYKKWIAPDPTSGAYTWFLLLCRIHFP